MPGQKLKLGSPEIEAVINEIHASEPDGWRKNRLLAVKLAAEGSYTSAEVAEICGIARGYLFEWLKAAREGGLEALLSRGKPGPKEGTMRGLAPGVQEQLRNKVAAGDFVTIPDAQRWLESAYGERHPYHRVWAWVKKAREGAPVAAPQPH